MVNKPKGERRWLTVELVIQTQYASKKLPLEQSFSNNSFIVPNIYSFTAQSVASLWHHYISA